MRFAGVFILLSLSVCATAQSDQRIHDHIRKSEYAILQEFVQFLAIPNVAADTAGLQQTASFIMDVMKRNGISQVRTLPAKTPGVPPAVYGEVLVPGATQTIVFYAHYDGQPVNAANWQKGLQPFVPQLAMGTPGPSLRLLEMPAPGTAIDREWRIYARGASDDKAGVMAILKAYETLRANQIRPSVNIKFFFEGEEEKGSDHLEETLEAHKALLKSDLWVICDGPVHQSGRKVVGFGVRGDTQLEITVYGARKPLHSGHYGNWVPNPAMDLVQLLATMKDKSGKVTIDGFYDDVIPLSASEKQAIDAIPPVEQQMKTELGITRVESVKSLPETYTLPSLNINGIRSAETGKLAANVIPVKATVNLDLRLVAGNEWQRQQDKVIAHIRKQGYFVSEQEPTDAERQQYAYIAQVTRSKGYNAQKTSMDLPEARKVIAAVQSTTRDKVVLIPSFGGSLPLYIFEKVLNAKTISVPIANHDNNQHAENENIRLRNLFEGIETMAAIMTMR
jgi:acetylornithine deacetylase/succinyl-diaminopimelate desuccinylase-like protein